MAFLGVALLILPGCRRQRVPNDELVVLIEQPPRNLDPRYLTTAYDYKLAFLVYARLVSVDTETLEPRMDLADHVDVLPRPEVSEGQPQPPLTMEVTLRSARFSDGSPVTADDVAYTFDRLLDEKTGSAPLRRRFTESGLLRPLTILGPQKLRITLRTPTASYLTDLDFGILKRGSADADPSAESTSILGGGGLVGGAVDLPIGAGPFIPETPAGEVTRFVKNPHYYGGAPPIDRLTVRVVRDANSRLLSLVGGSADLTQNTVSPLLFDVVKKWQSRLQLESAPSALLFYLGMNNEDPRLQDPRVRRAICQAIDREQIVRTKVFGKARLATSLLAPFHWAYSPPSDETKEALKHDPAAARALLDAAGFPDPDGPGPQRRFTLTYKTSTDALPGAIARVIAAQLAEVGIGVEVRPLEFHLFLSDVKKGNYHLYTLSSAEIAEPNMFRNFFHSDYIPNPKNLDAGGLNRMRYKNPELDALLDAGNRELTREKRKVIYQKVQEILLRDLPMLPLWHPDNIVVARKEVHGYKLFPSAQFSGLSTVYKGALR